MSPFGSHSAQVEAAEALGARDGAHRHQRPQAIARLIILLAIGLQLPVKGRNELQRLHSRWAEEAPRVRPYPLVRLELASK